MIESQGYESKNTKDEPKLARRKLTPTSSCSPNGELIGGELNFSEQKQDLTSHPKSITSDSTSIELKGTVIALEETFNQVQATFSTMNIKGVATIAGGTGSGGTGEAGSGTASGGTASGGTASGGTAGGTGSGAGLNSADPSTVETGGGSVEATGIGIGGGILEDTEVIDGGKEVATTKNGMEVESDKEEGDFIEVGKSPKDALVATMERIVGIRVSRDGPKGGSAWNPKDLVYMIDLISKIDPDSK